jgi:hypothetical protein
VFNSLHIARSFVKTRRPWFLSPSDKALATAPFPSGMVGRFREAQFRDEHERLGFSTANDHILNDLWAALADEPKAQLHGCATLLFRLPGSA